MTISWSGNFSSMGALYPYIGPHRASEQASCLTCGSDGKEFACNAGDPGSIPGLGRSPGEKNDYAFQYSHQENSMDRGAKWATVHRVAESETTK